MKSTIVLIPSLAIVTVGFAIASDELENAVAMGVTQLASNDNLEEVVETKVSEMVDSSVESKLRDWLPNAEVSIEGVSKGKPTFGIVTLTPLYESADKTETVFNQASLFKNAGRQTLNLGIGYRRLSADETWLFGANAFYDYEFPHDHQRSSVGIEASSSVISFNANQYFGLSGWRAVDATVEEKALGGDDVEVGLSLPYIPSSRLYYKTFRWNAVDGASDLKGTTTSLAISGDVLIPGLGLELGATNYDGRSDSEFVKLTFKYPPPEKRSPLFANVAYELVSMKDKRLEKVRRTNKIVKQTRSSSSNNNTVSFR